MIERAGARVRVRIDATLHPTEARDAAARLTELATVIEAEVPAAAEDAVIADVQAALAAVELDDRLRALLARRIGVHLARAAYRRPDSAAALGRLETRP